MYENSQKFHFYPTPKITENAILYLLRNMEGEKIRKITRVLYLNPFLRLTSKTIEELKSKKELI